MERKLDIIPVGQWNVFPEGTRPLVIAGPCSAESERQVMETASALKAEGIQVFRAGIWKPRTHPGCFEGVGEKGLPWLARVQRELGMKVCTEVACKEHIDACSRYGIDLFWIGARTSANPFLMQEIADAMQGKDIPVLVKNPVSQEIELWKGALERLNRAGVRKLGVIHRGFSSFEKQIYRNSPGWNIAIELRAQYPEMPFFADPSHMGGERKYVAELSQKSMDLGLDGLMIESHICPDSALSDAFQQLCPAALSDLLSHLEIREMDSDCLDYREHISELRAQIDMIDDNILEELRSRKKISRQIGQYKKEHNIAILQASRWDALLEDVVRKSAHYGLSEKCVTAIFNAIHEESVQVQNEVISNHGFGNLPEPESE